MITETMILWLVLCVAVAVLAWLMRSVAISIVSSFGLLITGFQYYTENEDIFVMAMLMMLAFALPIAIMDRRKKGH